MSLGFSEISAQVQKCHPNNQYTQIFPSVSPKQGDLTHQKGQGPCTWRATCDKTVLNSRYKTKHRNYIAPLQK